MKRYIRAAVNISDIEAKISKKQAEIDKKTAWIQKKEANIKTKMQMLSEVLDSETCDRLTVYLDYLKNNQDYRIPDNININTWQIARENGWDYDSKIGKALYSIDDDAKSIYNSKKVIEEAQKVIDGYADKISTLRAKDAEIDRIPDCLKDFMNDIVDRWDDYDIKLRDESEPFYWDLKHKADEILYEGNPTKSYRDAEAKLKEMYPDINRSWERSKRFENEYVEIPFRHKFGQSTSYARAFWDMSDEKIHDENVRAGKALILDLLKRVTKITGPVRDWNGLDLAVGNGGRLVLNGVVMGEDSKARVESILAEGPVQRLHVRTLVKPIR